MKEKIGILLAGGLSRRFGSPKAFARAEGKFYYERVFEALDPVCEHVVIVTSPELLARFPKAMDVITDLPVVAGLGPLAGIFSAMSMREAEQYIILPCDMPFVGAAEMQVLIGLSDSFSDITAVKTREEAMPLVSIWNIRLKNQLQLELANGQKSVMKFLEKVNTNWLESVEINADPQVFRNVNRPE